MNTLKTFYKMPTILKILLGLLTFPLGTFILLVVNTVAREAIDIQDTQEKIEAVWANMCDDTVRDLTKQLQPKRVVTISVGVTSVKTDIPQRLAKLLPYVQKSENVSESVKKELYTAVANKQYFGNTSSGPNYSHINQMNMNETNRQMEEMNEQMRLFDEMNRQHEFMFQQNMQEFQQQQFDQQQQQFTDHMLHM